MADQGTKYLHTTFALLGDVATCIMFLSPIMRDTGAVQHFPYLFGAIYCFLGLFYAVDISKPLLSGALAFGLVLQIGYLSVYICVSAEANRRLTITSTLLGVGAALIVGISSMTVFQGSCRKHFLEIANLVALILLYASPILVVVEVMRQRNSAQLQSFECWAGFFNSMIWFVDAMIPDNDTYGIIANGVGLLIGVLQITLLRVFPNEGQNPDPELPQIEGPPNPDPELLEIAVPNPREVQTSTLPSPTENSTQTPTQPGTTEILAQPPTLSTSTGILAQAPTVPTLPTTTEISAHIPTMPTPTGQAPPHPTLPTTDEISVQRPTLSTPTVRNQDDDTRLEIPAQDAVIEGFWNRIFWFIWFLCALIQNIWQSVARRLSR